MGGLAPPAAMATGRWLCGAQNRCHMGRCACVGGGERDAGNRGGAVPLELNGPTRGNKSHLEGSAEQEHLFSFLSPSFKL